MAAAMARQEHHVDAVKVPVRSWSDGSPQGHLTAAIWVFQAGNFINAGAADDAENCFGHIYCRSRYRGRSSQKKGAPEKSALLAFQVARQCPDL